MSTGGVLFVNRHLKSCDVSTQLGLGFRAIVHSSGQQGASEGHPAVREKDFGHFPPGHREWFYIH